MSSPQQAQLSRGARIAVSDDERAEFIRHAEEIAREWQRRYGRGVGVRRIYYRLRGVSWSVVQEGGRWPDWVKNNLIAARRNYLKGDRGPMSIDPGLFSEEGRELVSWSHHSDIEDWAYSIPPYVPHRWENQTHRVLVVCEKDGLAGLVEQACEPFQVSYICTNGNASISAELKVQRRIEGWQRQGLKPHLLYVGDHDCAGVHMDRKWVENINLDHGIFERVAITLEQAGDLGLEFETVDPNKPRYTKSGTIDKTWPERARKYVERFGEPGATTAKAIELDMIDHGLEGLIQEATKKHIDQEAWDEKFYAGLRVRDRVDELVEQIRGQL
jgi:hypothetical protein